MEVIGLLTDNLGAVAFAILGMGGVISFCYAGWLYQTAFGDQQQMAKARNAFFGGCIGLLIGGFSFAIPEILSSEIIGRSGGDEIVVRASSECDEILKNRLVQEVQANTPAKMRQIVRYVQADGGDGCSSDVWDPFIGQDHRGSLGTSYVADYRMPCFGGTGGTPLLHNVDRPERVGGIAVPGGLLYDEGTNVGRINRPRPESSRDISNNIIVYFGQLQDNTGSPKEVMTTGTDKVSESIGFPTSGERCWLFIARQNLWVGN